MSCPTRAGTGPHAICSLVEELTGVNVAGEWHGNGTLIADTLALWDDHHEGDGRGPRAIADPFEAASAAEQMFEAIGVDSFDDPRAAELIDYLGDGTLTITRGNAATMANMARLIARAREKNPPDPNVPVSRTYRSVTHVGTLDPGQRMNYSLEGEGLSVSVHPDEWEQIARIGGRPHWEITRPDGTPLRFLDAHELTDTQRETIHQWGIEQGIVEQTTAYTVTSTDEEGDEWVSTFATREEALGEIGEYDPEWDSEASEEEYIANRVDEVTRLKFTDGHEQRGGSVGNVEDVLLTVWADQTDAGYDGVWWHDTLDPAALSAPRGVILPSKVAILRIEPADY